MMEFLDAGEVARRMKERPGAVVLLDVREPYERRMASIEPSLHIPMNEVPQRLDEIPKDREVVVYCHSGSRSMMVAGFLSGQGYRSVANLTGGIDAWSVEVDPSVPRYD
jgi:rhodanese-related sulfurtransferase